ncbi:MAG: hypothetical protein Q9195_004939 [Heterodermia aff. obscurata]
MDIDVLGSYNTLKATLPSLAESAKRTKTQSSLSPLGGRIIFVSATLHYTGTPLQAHVGVAKAGVDALSNSVAIEFGPRGMTSNVIAPGPIAGTEGMERLSRKEDAAAGKKNIPLGRWGTVREIADATVYLFSEAASYVNGTTLVGESNFPLFIHDIRLHVPNEALLMFWFFYLLSFVFLRAGSYALSFSAAVS